MYGITTDTFCIQFNTWLLSVMSTFRPFWHKEQVQAVTLRELTQQTGLHVAYLITPCSTVLLEKLTGSQPINKFPAFYGSSRFITAFTSARHLSLTWASSIQSIPPHPTLLRSILILSSHLRLDLPSVIFPSITTTTTTTTTTTYLLHEAQSFLRS